MTTPESIELLTSAGKLRGRVDDGVCSFKGIAYGASTDGEHRFRPPAPVTPWDGVRDAFTFGPTCPQVGMTGGFRNRSTEVVPGMSDPADEGEDCLVLNVWTPAADDNRRPVLVWLHGGGLHAGSASSPLYDGEALARHGDVVVVGVNHRLGVLGLLHLAPTMGDELASAGMLTFLDIAAALQWVHDEIAAFGGDPENVTIFGQSGGGQKVGVLLAVPAAQGLFQRAICQSGSARRVGTRMDPAELAEFVLTDLDVAPGDLGHLQSIPVDRIVHAAARATDQFGAMVFCGVVDGVVLPAQPQELIAMGSAKSVPLLAGTTADEFRGVGAAPGFDTLDDPGLRAMLGGVIGRKDTGYGTEGPIAAYRSRFPDATNGFLFGEIFTDYAHIGVEQTADAKAQAASAPVYRYVFTNEPSHHGAELQYLFRHGNDRALDDIVSDTWLAFARYGHPHTDHIPTWPVYDTSTRTTAMIDRQTAVAEDPFQHARELWESVDSTL